jgi:hypothetical protein
MSWLPATFAHPERLDLASGHHLRPIRATDVDLDYPAVMGSRDRLWMMFGRPWEWPRATMTFEQDLADLERHEREIRDHESFNYAIFDAGETVLLGCVYIDPDDTQVVDADVCWWVVDDAVGSALELALTEAVPGWLDDRWPFERVRYFYDIDASA